MYQKQYVSLYDLPVYHLFDSCRSDIRLSFIYCYQHLLLLQHQASASFYLNFGGADLFWGLEEAIELLYIFQNKTSPEFSPLTCFSVPLYPSS